MVSDRTIAMLTDLVRIGGPVTAIACFALYLVANISNRETELLAKAIEANTSAMERATSDLVRETKGVHEALHDLLSVERERK